MDQERWRQQVTWRRLFPSSYQAALRQMLAQLNPTMAPTADEVRLKIESITGRSLGGMGLAPLDRVPVGGLPAGWGAPPGAGTPPPGAQPTTAPAMTPEEKARNMLVLERSAHGYMYADEQSLCAVTLNPPTRRKTGTCGWRR